MVDGVNHLDLVSNVGYNGKKSSDAMEEMQ